MTKWIPILTAAMVLAIRVLLINTFSNYGDQALALNRKSKASAAPAATYKVGPLGPATPRPSGVMGVPPGVGISSKNKPMPSSPSRPLYNEPTYHPTGKGNGDRPTYPTGK